ncbi:MAG: hypothetical protein LBG30_01290, partial [Odoribacteraceae bacterium]|nr:hypothetical protein [Odoribacteraceae bacterium]
MNERMTTLKDAIEEISGLRHAIDRVQTLSGAGRRALLDSPYLTGEEIQRELDRVESLMPLLPWPAVCSPMSRVKDVRHAIERLGRGETPDDVELFEIKSFALLAAEIASAIRAVCQTANDASPTADNKPFLGVYSVSAAENKQSAGFYSLPATDGSP